MKRAAVPFFCRLNPSYELPIAVTVAVTVTVAARVQELGLGTEKKLVWDVLGASWLMLEELVDPVIVEEEEAEAPVSVTEELDIVSPGLIEDVVEVDPEFTEVLPVTVENIVDSIVSTAVVDDPVKVEIRV